MIGGGGHARVLTESLRLSGVQLEGFIASDREPSIEDVSWLGADSVLDTLDPRTVTLVNGVGSVGDSSARVRVWDLAKSRGFTFGTVVDPTALVRPSAIVGEGVQVLMGALVGTEADLGPNCIVNSGAVVDHGVRVGAHSHVSPGAAIAGDVTVGRETHIGLGARVIQRIRIGSRSVVGAGAVVIRDVGDDEVALGVPATARQLDRPNG